MQAQTRVRTAQIALIALTIITALIHFQRAMEDPDIRILFNLNGLGYFALLAAFYCQRFKDFIARWVGCLLFTQRLRFCFTLYGLP